MAYLLDANIFIEAKNFYYGLDFCPAFWDWLIQKNAQGGVFSIQKVGDELDAGDDPLADWASERGAGFFLKPDPSILPALSTVSTWVTSQRYEQAAVNTFLQKADCFLIAHALAHRMTVVTREKVADSIMKVKIPNVCIGLQVNFMTPFEMLQHERARYVLGE